jgi:hypothetical protein
MAERTEDVPAQEARGANRGVRMCSSVSHSPEASRPNHPAVQRKKGLT